MTRNSFHGAYGQRQLRVGELIKQNLGQIFLKNEAKIPSSVSYTHLTLPPKA